MKQIDRHDDVKPKKSKIWNLKIQIIAIAFISVAGFALYTVVTTTVLNKSARLLDSIEQDQYPLQANLLSALHTLKFLQSDLELSVITGDIEQLNETLITAARFKELVSNAVLHSSTYEKELADISAEFQSYFDRSYFLATRLIEPGHEVGELMIPGEHPAEQYYRLVSRLSALRNGQTSNLSTLISSANRQASKSTLLLMALGFAIGCVLLLIAVNTGRRIITRINAIVDSLRIMAEENGDMKVRIDVAGNDEMSELAHWFNSFIGKLDRETEERTNDIKRLAYSDQLSGLPNRRKLFEFLTDELRADKHCDKSLTVLLLDLDKFKSVNDEFGHDAGDELIKLVAQRLQEVVFEKDIHLSKAREESGEEQAMVARLGGDEFMIVLSGSASQPHSRADIEQLAESICTAMLAPFDIRDFSCQIGLSVGVSRYPLDSTDVTELVTYADMAMYLAKSTANDVCFFDRSIADKFQKTNQIQSALVTAIANNEFTIMFQPKYRLSDSEYCGAEVLIRWFHPSLGNVRPDIFIPLAEQSAIILKIDQWVLEETCRHIVQWMVRGLYVGRISINVSARQIGTPGYAKSLLHTVQHHGISTSILEIEITETSALGDVTVVGENVRQLSEAGVSVAIDDFGAGHSSLQLLIESQIDTLKIDRSLINKIESDHKSLSVVNTLVQLAKYLNIESVAEGVETDEQRVMLRDEIACDVAQGYFFDKPLSADEIVSRMQVIDPENIQKLAS